VTNPIRPTRPRRPATISTHLIRLLVLFTCLLFSSLAPAALVDARTGGPSLSPAGGLQAAGPASWPAAEAAPIAIAEHAHRTHILAALQVLRRAHDDVADVREVLAAPDWAPVGDALIASSFKPATLWLLGRLRNDSDVTQTRALSVQPWRVEHIEFSVIDPIDGTVLQTVPGGIAALRTTGTPSATFGVQPGITLEVPAGSERLLLIRLTDRTIGEVDVWLQTPEQASAELQVDLVIQSVLLAAALTIAVILLLQLRLSCTLAAVFLVASIAFELSYERWLLVWLFPSLVGHLIPLFTTAGAIVIAGFSVFSLAMLGVFRHRPLAWLHALVSALLVGVALSTLMIDAHHLARLTITVCGLGLLLLWPLFAWGWRDRTLPYGRILAGVLTVCWLATTARLLIAMLLVPLSTAPMLWLTSLVISCATLLAAVALAVLSARDLRERAARDAMLASEREIGEAFARGIVHDINNLLTVLSLELHQLEAPAGQYTAVQRRDMVATARQVIEQGSVMTRGSLLLSTRTPLPLAPVCVGELLQRLAGRMRDAVSPQVRIVRTLTTPEPLPRVQTCEVALELSLMNMILNANQAITGCGEIRLQAGVLADTHKQAPDLGVLPGSSHCMVISVEDTGHGIDPQLRNRLFEPLVSTRCRDGGPCGHGLGLFMVAQFVRLTGAGLRVGHSPEGGARFELLLPLAASHAGTAAPGGQPSLAA
jgi:signal transduction histidine kinase